MRDRITPVSTASNVAVRCRAVVVALPGVQLRAAVDRTHWLVALLLIFVASSHITTTAVGQCQYEVTAIIQGPPCLGGGFAPLVGRGMNSHGHVVGSWNHCNGSNDEAFYWTPETGRVTLPRPDGVASATANDINDHGQIVGRHRFVGIGWKGFVYDINRQQFTYLEPLHDGVVATDVTTLNAINNAGIAVGSRAIGKPGVHPIPYNAVIWNTNTGEITDLGVGRGPRSEAMDISESGEYVVGWANGSGPLFGQAAIWINGRLQVIGPLPGTDNSIVNAVNESGVAVGSGLNQTVGWRAFIWDGAFTIIDGTDGWQNARGEATNDLGQAFIRFSNPSPHVAMLWQHGELHHLNALLADGSPDVHVTGVTAANNNGQVLCTASTRAVLLTPADRPLTDLNADCRTDVHDLLILLDAWGPLPRAKQSTGLPADLNGDGVVNVSDLLILLAHWTYEGR